MSFASSGIKSYVVCASHHRQIHGLDTFILSVSYFVKLYNVLTTVRYSRCVLFLHTFNYSYVRYVLCVWIYREGYNWLGWFVMTAVSLRCAWCDQRCSFVPPNRTYVRSTILSMCLCVYICMFSLQSWESTSFLVAVCTTPVRA